MFLQTSVPRSVAGGSNSGCNPLLLPTTPELPATRLSPPPAAVGGTQRWGKEHKLIEDANCAAAASRTTAAAIITVATQTLFSEPLRRATRGNWTFPSTFRAEDCARSRSYVVHFL